MKLFGDRNIKSIPHFPTPSSGSFKHSGPFNNPIVILLSEKRNADGSHDIDVSVVRLVYIIYVHTTGLEYHSDGQFKG
jgi:hypothetical protein